jgi:hypothetical protein
VLCFFLTLDFLQHLLRGHSHRVPF